MKNWETLSRLPRRKIENIQNKKLRFFIKHLLPFHPFLRDHLKKHAIQSSDIQNTADLQKIPLISKQDILPTENIPDKPRQFILQPDTAAIKKHYPKSRLIKYMITGNLHESLEREFKPIHIHFTTGRSSAQIPFLYSARDLATLAQTGSRIFQTAGLAKEDIVVNAFPFAPHLAFWQVQKATEAVGIRCLHTGGGKILGTEKILNALQKMEATILISLPGYGYHLVKEAKRQGRNFPKLRHIIFGGERVSPGLREKIKGMFPDVTILSTFASTEAKTAWVQCHEESGYHLYPDLEFVELVDEEGRRVKEGQPGEIVYTALDWRGSTVMRYRTGDMCAGLTYEPCTHCGRTTPRLHYEIERKSEHKELRLSKVKGELVNLNAFYPLLNGMKEIDEWQVEIRKKDNDVFELDELHVNVACVHGEECTACDVMVEEYVARELAVRPVVNMHDRQLLINALGMESELKEKRIVDRRV